MLTSTQYSALKAAVLADPTASVYYENGNDMELANWFNQPTTHVVWRSTMTPDIARAAIIEGATQLDALTVGKRDSLFWLASGNLDVSKPSVRAAIDDLCGSQNTLKSALQAAERRTCSRVEKLLSTGAGTTAEPALLGFEGEFSSYEIQFIRVVE